MSARPRACALAAILLLGACGASTGTQPEPVFVPFKPVFRGFTAVAPLPEARAYAPVIESGGFLYAVGGLPPAARSSNTTVTVFFTRILADGSLEPWRETASLNVPRSRTALVAFNPSTGPRALFALGGHTEDLSGLASVERAFLQPDGSLSSWEIVSNLPAVLGDGVVSQIGDTVILTGGFPAGNSNEAGADQVFVGTLGPAGPGAWRAAARLPETMIGGAALAVGNRVHVVIGYTHETQWSRSVYSGTLDGSGTISAWVKGPSIGFERYFMGAAPDGHGGLFLLGGIGRAGHLAPSEHSATDPAGNLVGWTQLGALPVATGSTAAVNARNAIYVVGGLVGSGHSLDSTAAVWRTALD